MSNGTATWNGGNADWLTLNWLATSGLPLVLGLPSGADVVIANGATVSIGSAGLGGSLESVVVPTYDNLTVGDGTSASALNVYGSLSAGGYTTVQSGSSLTVESGGSAAFGYYGLTVNAGAALNIYGAASMVQNAELYIYGSATVSGATASLATAYSVIVETGGSLSVSNGGQATATLLTVNGTLDVATGSSLVGNNTLTVNGTMTVEGTYYGLNGLQGTGTVIVNGGQLGTSAEPTYFNGTSAQVIVTNGGTVYLTNANQQGLITFETPTNGATNTLIITQRVSQVNTPIVGFGAGSVIQFAGNNNLTITGVTVTAGSATGTYQVALSDNSQAQITLTNVTFAAGITPVANGNGTFSVTGITDSLIGTTGTYELNTCFLAGSAIATPHGNAAVEDLRPGDLVNTVVAGKIVAKAVKWIGHRHIKPGEMQSDEAHPVRVKKGAFSHSVPQRDLLLTGEHCVFVDGGLVPVRMLVNGRSIILDETIDDFTYYHVELEEHAILLAEGLTVESYLDTGNRGKFENAHKAGLHAQFACTASITQPAAPFMLDVARVKPVWERLDLRAYKLGAPSMVRPASLSHDAELHIVTASGETIQPKQYNSGKAIFELPANQTGFSLASRTARPCDTMAPYIDDRRHLGVAVGQMKLHFGGDDMIGISMHLERADLAGWHGLEGATHRWTGGLAELPINNAHKPALLEIQILQAGPYLETQPRAAGVSPPAA